MASWLLGVGNHARSRFTRRLAIAGAILLWIGGYFAFSERPLRQSDARAATEQAGIRSGALPQTGNITWEPYSPEKADALARAGRPVFVDFTAEWCITCKRNEHSILSLQSVGALFEKHNVAALRADYTRRDAELSKILASFGSSGVPLYVLFPAGKPLSPIVLPTWLSENVIHEALNGGNNNS
jgi:thiol:disulfide interchange protein